MAELYPCSSKVKIPSLGVHLESDKVQSDIKDHYIKPSKSTVTSYSPRVISELSTRLKFETHPDLQPYSEARSNIGLLCRLPKTTSVRHERVGRCNTRGDDIRHIPCHLQSSVSKWETSLLNSVSLTTAKHIVRYSSKGKRKVKQMEEERKERMKCNKELSTREQLSGEFVNTVPPVISNGYITELSTGAVPVHVKGTGDTILLSNRTTFKKVLQTLYPPSPGQFLGNKYYTGQEGRIIKGHRRWIELPERTSTPPEEQWLLPSDEQQKRLAQVSPTDDDTIISQTDIKQPSTVTIFNKIDEHISIVKELLVKWQVHAQSCDITECKAIECLNAVSSNTKLYGLGIVISLLIKILNRKDHQKADLSVTGKRGGEENENYLNDKIISKISNLLSNETERIKVISAIILLCCTDDMKDKAIDALELASHYNDSAEQWSAVQSLAIEGICTPTVVKTLLSTYNHYTVTLLSRISHNSSLVNAMLLEQLNSKSCHERYTTCKLLPELHGGINKDVCNRLVTMSWDDWSEQVRLAAAQTLGKTGQAKLIHDEIEKRLKKVSESSRLDALRKLHTLQLMTSRLLPSFVECFKDEHISVKLKAITVAQVLHINDESVISSLKQLMEDSSWKVKAHAIRALGVLRARRPEILSHLLWAVRFERLPQVRAESCHALQLMGVKNDKVANALKDILIVEDNPLVINQAKNTLIHLGYEPVAEDKMATSVCEEVKRLGSQSAITQQIQSLKEKEMVHYIINKPNTQLSSRDHMAHTLRGWSPDRKGINKRLNVIGHLSQLDPNNILTT